MKKIILILLIAIITHQTEAQTALTTAVDFNVVTVHGDSINLFSILDGGQYVLLDFFFTTCAPCNGIIPDLNTLFRDYGCNSGDVFMLSIDEGDTHQQVLINELQYNSVLPTVSGKDGGGNAVISAYGITSYPSILLITPDRQIIEQDIWPFSTVNGTAAFINAGIQSAACQATGISERDFFNELLVFPNPVSQLLNIGFDLKENTVLQFDLIDAGGRVVNQTASYLYNSGQHSLQMDLDRVSAGFYILNITADGKHYSQRKISVIN